ncbi:MAG: T9SS type A sorting domain-containing protein [Bacteroidota bacterium]
MKNVFSLILCFLLISPTAWTQTAFNLSFANGVRTGSQYCVDVAVSFDAAGKLGSSNLVFTFDENVIHKPQVESSILSSPLFYRPVGVSTPATGRASINIVLNATGSGFGQDIGTTPLAIARVCFDVVDANQLVELEWQVNANAATVVFDDNALGNPPTSLAPGILTDYAQSIFPVEWLSFTATLQEGDALLQWATGSELNNDYFDVERALPQEDFQVVGQINAVGTTSQTSRYQFRDPTIRQFGAEKLQYRLRQVDLDGSFSYSRILEVAIDDQANMEVYVYPNTFQDRLNIEFLGVGEQRVDFAITSTTGQTVWQAQSHHMRQAYEVPTRDWARGIYYLSVTSENSKQVFKVLCSNEK